MVRGIVFISGHCNSYKGKGFLGQLKYLFKRKIRGFHISTCQIYFVHKFVVELIAIPPAEIWEKITEKAKNRTLKSISLVLRKTDFETLIIQEDLEDILSSIGINSSERIRYQKIAEKLNRHLIIDMIKLIMGREKNFCRKMLTITDINELYELEEVLYLAADKFRNINVFGKITAKQQSICDKICKDLGISVYLTEDLKILEKTDILISMKKDGNVEDYPGKVILIPYLMEFVNRGEKREMIYSIPNRWIKKLGRTIIKRFENDYLAIFLLLLAAKKETEGMDIDGKYFYGQFVRNGFSIVLR